MSFDFVALLRREGAVLAAACRSGPLDAPVPGCPGWDVSALLVHTSRVHRMATAAVLGGGEAPGRAPRPADDVVGWYEDGLAALLDALAATPEDAPAWTFLGPHGTAGFWRRRMAHETAVHRWDAESARGDGGSIEARFATDGLDELLDVFGPRRVGQVEGGIDTGGTIHLHCTDVEGEWTFQGTGGGFEWSRGHSKGDVALRGPAEALLLIMWGRKTLETPGIEVFGDPAVLGRWLAVGM